MVGRLSSFLLGWPIFRGELLVSGRVIFWPSYFQGRAVSFIEREKVFSKTFNEVDWAVLFFCFLIRPWGSDVNSFWFYMAWFSLVLENDLCFFPIACVVRIESLRVSKNMPGNSASLWPFLGWWVFSRDPFKDQPKVWGWSNVSRRQKLTW